MRYYRRFGKGISYKKMSAHLTKLKKLEKYQAMIGTSKAEEQFAPEILQAVNQLKKGTYVPIEVVAVEDDF